jgi:hypothetical protein
MAKFLIPPLSPSYSVEGATEEVLRAQLDGGASKFRADIIGAALNVACNWQFDPSENEYFWAFFRTATSRGALPFEIDLLIDNSELTEYSAHFVGKPKLTQQSGLTYYVSAMLEVMPNFNPTEAEDDEATIEAFETAWALAHP